MEHKVNISAISANSSNAELNHTWNGTLVNMDALHLLIYPCPCVAEDGGCLKQCRADVYASCRAEGVVASNVLTDV